METVEKVLILGCGSVGYALTKQILVMSTVSHLVVVDSSESNIFVLQEYIRQMQINSGCAVCANIEFVLGDANNKLMTRDPRLVSTEWDVVFHCAAYKHVGFCEDNSAIAWHNNLGLVSNLLISNVLSAKRLVFVSTDKAVYPSTQMGWTKRVSEWGLQKWSAEEGVPVSIVRFGNVLASSGSIIPLLRSQIRSGGPVTITSESAQRYFISLDYAASCLISAASICEIGGPVYVIKMGELVSIIDLAKSMILSSGFSWRMKGQEPALGSIEIELIGLRQGEKLIEDLTEGSLIATPIDCLLRSEGEMLPGSGMLDEVLRNPEMLSGKSPSQIRELF